MVIIWVVGEAVAGLLEKKPLKSKWSEACLLMTPQLCHLLLEACHDDIVQQDWTCSRSERPPGVQASATMTPSQGPASYHDRQLHTVPWHQVPTGSTAIAMRLKSRAVSYSTKERLKDSGVGQAALPPPWSLPGGHPQDQRQLKSVSKREPPWRRCCCLSTSSLEKSISRYSF